MKKTQPKILVLIFIIIFGVNLAGCGGGSSSPTQVTLTISYSGNGTTTPAAGSHQYDQGTVVTLTANPDTGWAFSNWGGANGDQVSNNTLTMSENKSITAVFMRNLVVNPGFETTVGGTWVFNTFYGSYDATHARSGSYCFSYTLGSCYAEQYINSGFTPGSTLKASFWGYADNASSFVRLAIDFKDGSDTLIGSPVQLDSTPGPTNYTKYELTNILIPLNTARIRVYITGGGTGTAYADDVIVGF